MSSEDCAKDCFKDEWTLALCWLCAQRKNGLTDHGVFLEFSCILDESIFKICKKSIVTPRQGETITDKLA